MNHSPLNQPVQQAIPRAGPTNNAYLAAQGERWFVSGCAVWFLARSVRGQRVRKRVKQDRRRLLLSSRLVRFVPGRIQAWRLGAWKLAGKAIITKYGCTRLSDCNIVSSRFEPRHRKRTCFCLDSWPCWGLASQAYESAMLCCSHESAGSPKTPTRPRIMAISLWPVKLLYLKTSSIKFPSTTGPPATVSHWRSPPNFHPTQQRNGLGRGSSGIIFRADLPQLNPQGRSFARSSQFTKPRTLMAACFAPREKLETKRLKVGAPNPDLVV